MESDPGNPFAIMNRHIDQQQKAPTLGSLGPKHPWDAEDWSGAKSREWTQNLERLHDPETTSSLGLEPLTFPEQGNMLVMPIDDDDLTELGADEHISHRLQEENLPGDPRALQRLHAEMDALIADSEKKPRPGQPAQHGQQQQQPVGMRTLGQASMVNNNLDKEMDMLLSGAQPERLTPQQRMLLRQAEISKMQAYRPRPIAGYPGMPMAPYPGAGPDYRGAGPVQRKPEKFDEGGLFSGIACFRACS